MLQPILHTDVAKLLDKIVSCALDDGIVLKPFPVKDPTGGDGTGSKKTRLAGELGLCGTRSSFGDWHTAALSDAATKSCQEAVTACVLARVNALGHRIVISIRTQADMPIRLHEQVLGIREALVDRDPGNLRYRSDLAWCWRELGLALK